MVRVRRRRSPGRCTSWSASGGPSYATRPSLITTVAVDQRRHRAELVGDQHDRRTAVRQQAQGFGQGLLAGQVDAGGRLVEDEQLGLAGQCARDQVFAAAVRPTSARRRGGPDRVSPTTSIASSMAFRSARVSGRSSRRRVRRPDPTTSRTETAPRWLRRSAAGRTPPAASHGTSRSACRTATPPRPPAAAARSSPGPASTSRSRWRPSARRTPRNGTVRSMPRRIGRPAMATLPSRTSTGATRGQHPLAFFRATRFARMRER